MFVGEVDLTQEVRGISREDCEALANNLTQETAPTVTRRITTIFVSAQSRDALADALARNGSRVNVRGVTTLGSLVSEIWPETMEWENTGQEASDPTVRTVQSQIRFQRAQVVPDQIHFREAGDEEETLNGTI